MSLPHVADAEAEFVVVNIEPDFCEVEGQVVPFDIARALPTERGAYAATVIARGEKVLMVDSVIDGVDGDVGVGVISGTSLVAGANVMLSGAGTVLVEGRALWPTR